MWAKWTQEEAFTILTDLVGGRVGLFVGLFEGDKVGLNDGCVDIDLDYEKSEHMICSIN